MPYVQLRLRLASVFLMLALPAISHEIAIAQSPAVEGENSGSGSKSAAERPIVPSEAAEIEIVFGRLQLVPHRFRILRRQETFVDGTGWRTLQVSAVEGRPNLRACYYEESDKWSLQFDATIGAQWSRETTCNGRPLKIDYSQKPQQPVVILITGLQPKPTKISGASLWHLTEQNAPEFASFVLPALKRLNCAWDLPGTLATAKQFRLQAGLDEDQIDRPALVQCVADLESSERAVRADAVERLRIAGVTAQIPLFQMTQSQLTTQQRKTIEQLLTALEPRTADTPTRLAYWLSGDPSWR